MKEKRTLPLPFRGFRSERFRLRREKWSVVVAEGPLPASESPRGTSIATTVTDGVRLPPVILTSEWWSERISGSETQVSTFLSDSERVPVPVTVTGSGSVGEQEDVVDTVRKEVWVHVNLPVGVTFTIKYIQTPDSYL